MSKKLDAESRGVCATCINRFDGAGGFAGEGIAFETQASDGCRGFRAEREGGDGDGFDRKGDWHADAVIAKRPCPVTVNL